MFNQKRIAILEELIFKQEELINVLENGIRIRDMELDRSERMIDILTDGIVKLQEEKKELIELHLSAFQGVSETYGDLLTELQTYEKMGKKEFDSLVFY